MTEHNLDHLKVFAGKILTLTHGKEPLDNFAFPIKKLRAMAEYIRDVEHPQHTTEYNPKDDPSHEEFLGVSSRFKEPEGNAQEAFDDYKQKNMHRVRSPESNIQKNVLCIINQLVNEGIQPTLKNIGSALNNPCKKVVVLLVNELIEQGYIAREGEKRRIVLK